MSTRAATLYRVIGIDDGHKLEDFSRVTSNAKTAAGFLKLFYQRWPTAPRGDFEAEVTLDGANIFQRGTNKKVAQFLEK